LALSQFTSLNLFRARRNSHKSCSRMTCTEQCRNPSRHWVSSWWSLALRYCALSLLGEWTTRTYSKYFHILKITLYYYLMPNRNIITCDLSVDDFSEQFNVQWWSITTNCHWQRNFHENTYTKSGKY
jgi:hypothetical protein